MSADRIVDKIPLTLPFQILALVTLRYRYTFSTLRVVAVNWIDSYPSVHITILFVSSSWDSFSPGGRRIYFLTMDLSSRTGRFDMAAAQATEG